jgi:hypothetical protein
MELFATDRERLAFLLETDAALDLDFEALEAQAEAAAEEPSPGEQPKYITNYIGSKQKLVDWIWKHTPEGVESAADAFSGSAVVAYMYKTKGLRVLANDQLRYCHSSLITSPGHAAETEDKRRRTMIRAQRASQVKPLSAEPEQQPTFSAFPKGTLLESAKVPIADQQGIAAY